jgi:hypothetical protein
VGRDAPLAGLFQALDTAGTSPVTILQIGDSHTANDSFSGEMRARLQARFGNAGRGYLQPAIPFNYYRPAGVTVQADGFTKITSFSNDSSGPFGIAAVRAHADGPPSAAPSPNSSPSPVAAPCNWSHPPPRPSPSPPPAMARR